MLDARADAALRSVPPLWHQPFYHLFAENADTWSAGDRASRAWMLLQTLRAFNLRLVRGGAI